MQAARAQRRKERILGSERDRMALVSGGPVAGKEKCLELDDEDLDPALAALAGAKPDTGNAAAEATAEAAPAAAAAEPDAVQSTAAAEAPATEGALLDAALDDVFSEVLGPHSCLGIFFLRGRRAEEAEGCYCSPFVFSLGAPWRAILTTSFHLR